MPTGKTIVIPLALLGFAAIFVVNVTTLDDTVVALSAPLKLCNPVVPA